MKKLLLGISMMYMAGCATVDLVEVKADLESAGFEVTVEERGTVLFLPSALFAPRAVTLTPESQEKFKAVALAAIKQPGMYLYIEGHTDDVGPPIANYEYGLARAEHIKELLVNSGVSAARIDAVSEGEESPRCTNDTDAGRSCNRRVEVVMFPK